MKKLLLLSFLIVLPIGFSCSSQKEISERRSLMMPKLSEVPRNAGKYRDMDYSKRNKYQKKAYKRRTSKRR
jgi:hypothetical protein